MGKPTKKRNSYNSMVVKKLAKTHGLTDYYVRKCLRGDSNSLTSDTIRKKYKELTREIEEILKQ